MPPMHPYPAGMQPSGPRTEQETVTAKSPDAMESLREQLVQAITDQLHGGQPTPPQYQPTPYTPVQGFAMARNPQLAGIIQQTTQAPGQAQFQQQQAAFEQAMTGRREALTAGTSLLNAEARMPYQAGRPATGTITDETGRRTLVNIVRDPRTGGIVKVEEVGPSPFAPGTSSYVDPTTGKAQLGVVDKLSGTVRPVTAGGQAVGAVPPSGIVENVAASQANIQGINAMVDAYHEIRQHAMQQNPVSQVVGTGVGATGLGGMLAPEYNKYHSKVSAALNAYIKSVTGAQFSVEEMKRYEAMFPKPWDPEDVAATKFDSLRQRATADMQAKLKLYPSLGGQERPRIRRSNFNRLPPEEQQRALRDGVEVID